jgi:hypothetical protein
MAEKSGMNFVPELIYFIQRRTIGGWEDGRELLFLAPPHPHKMCSNKRKKYFCLNIFGGSNFVFENISLFKVETSPIATI